jgi:hypothetical protein
MEDDNTGIDEQCLKRRRYNQRRKRMSQKYGYALEVLVYMIQTGIRWKPPSSGKPEE